MPKLLQGKNKALYSKEAKRERAVKAEKVGVNQLTSAAKGGAGDDAASVASAASKGSASKAASSKQVKQALVFMQTFQMMGNLGSSCWTTAKTTRALACVALSSGICLRWQE